MMSADRLLLLLSVLLLARPVQAAVFSPVEDTEIDELETGTDCNNAGGSETTAEIGLVGAKPSKVNRYLVHFDLSSIPHGSTIGAAEFKLWVEDYTSPASTYRVEVDRLTQPRWQETQVNWSTYDCDANPALALQWCQPGGDFTLVDQSFADVSEASMGQWLTIPIPALVQRAVSEHGGHLHLLLRAEGDDEITVNRSIRVRTQNNATSKPTLTVTWTSPAPAPNPVWVSFRDETAVRLTAPAVSPENKSCAAPIGTAGWMSCDRLEKDIAVADFDDDGDQDVVIVRKQPFNMRGPEKDIFLRNEDGKLVDRTQHAGNTIGPFFWTPVSSDARDVFAGDLDGDGYEDLVVATTCNDPGGPKFYENLASSTGRCDNWPGFLDRTSAWKPMPYEADGQRFCAVGGGFVNDDGLMDLYLSNYDRVCPNDINTTASLNDHLLINGDLAAGGRFIDQTTARLGGNARNEDFGTSVELVSLDGIGRDDIARVRATTLETLLNAGGDNNFTGAKTDLGTSYMMTTGDLTGDGKRDVYQARDETDQWFKNTGTNPPFDALNPMQVGSAAADEPTDKLGGNTKMLDIDGDGDLDVGVADVDVEFPNSCNVCQVGVDAHSNADDTCSATGGGCTFPNHEGCTENNVTVAGPNRTRFTLVRNSTTPGNTALQNPWGTDDASQAFNLKTYDFAFLELNGDGCPDLFLGICNGYRVLIQNCPSTGAPN